MWVHADPTRAIVQAVERKCGKSYRLDDDEDLWLVLLGGSACGARVYVRAHHLP